MSDRRNFSVAEANALLPEVKRLLGHLRKAVGGLEELRAQLPREGEDLLKPPPDTLVDSQHFFLVSAFHTTLGRFQDLGVQIKDVARGLVDFPARLGQEEILLCWLEGEEDVRFYHDLQSGFAGRKPIEEIAGQLISFRGRSDEEGEE